MVTIQLPGTKPKSKSKDQIAGLNVTEINLNRSDSVQTILDNYRRQTSRQVENPLQNANAKQTATPKNTSALATKKLFQLLNEKMNNGELAKLEKQQSAANSVAEKNPLRLLPDTNSATLPDQIAKTVPNQKTRKRFRLTPAPGASVAKTPTFKPVQPLQPPQVKTVTPAPTQPMALPTQNNEWHSLDE